MELPSMKYCVKGKTGKPRRHFPEIKSLYKNERGVEMFSKIKVSSGSDAVSELFHIYPKKYIKRKHFE